MLNQACFRSGLSVCRRRASRADQARQKELPSKYLYDDIGSALFEVISVLPEYGLTRADERLLRRHAYEIVERLPSDWLPLNWKWKRQEDPLDSQALASRQKTYYCPIEISPSALAM